MYKYILAIITSGLLSVSVFAQTLGIDSQPAPAGEVLGAGNFIHVVADVNRTVTFYNELMGTEPRGGLGPRNFGPNPPVAAMYNAEGAEFGGGTFPVPGSSLFMEFLQWQGVDAETIRPRVYDAGTGVFVLLVKNLETSLAAVLRNGGSILSASGKPIRADGNSFIMVQDPDGYFIELIEMNALAAVDSEDPVFSARFRFSVSDIEESMRFFKQAFDFDLTRGADFTDDEIWGSLAGLGAVSVNMATGRVPGSILDVELTEFAVSGSEMLRQQLPMVGASMFRIFVRDLDTSVTKAIAAGAVYGVNNEQPVLFDNGTRMQVVKAPGGMLLQLVQRP